MAQIKKTLGYVGVSVIVYGVLSLLLWVVIAFGSSPILGPMDDGLWLWYSITWIPFCGTAIFLCFFHGTFASPILMSSTFLAIIATVSYVEDMFRADRHIAYCSGIAGVIILLRFFRPNKRE